MATHESTKNSLSQCCYERKHMPVNAFQRREICFWLCGVRREIVLKESGSRSWLGGLPTRNGAAGTFSASCSASPPDAISACTSAPCSEAFGKSEWLVR